jgi:hypothetical protein
MPVTYALVMINILCIVVCYQIAKERQANIRFWGWMAVLFGPFAVPFVFFAKAKDK